MSLKTKVSHFLRVRKSKGMLVISHGNHVYVTIPNVNYFWRVPKADLYFDPSMEVKFAEGNYRMSPDDLPSGVVGKLRKMTGQSQLLKPVKPKQGPAMKTFPF